MTKSSRYEAAADAERRPAVFFCATLSGQTVANIAELKSTNLAIPAIFAAGL
jgi:hypothetical protein